MRERRHRLREMFVPLVHSPGDAQADFGEADAIIAGVKHRAHFFAMELPHSDACFVAAYPAATTEAWLDGHNRAFAFFGGVPVIRLRLQLAREFIFRHVTSQNSTRHRLRLSHIRRHANGACVG